MDISVQSLGADTVAWHVKVFPRTCTAEKRQPHRDEERTDRATAGLVEEWQTSSSENCKISAFRVESELCVVRCDSTACHR